MQQSLSGADTIGEESSNLSDLKTDYGGPEYSLEERGQRIAAMVRDPFINYVIGKNGANKNTNNFIKEYDFS